MPLCVRLFFLWMNMTAFPSVLIPRIKKNPIGRSLQIYLTEIDGNNSLTLIKEENQVQKKK